MLAALAGSAAARVKPDDEAVDAVMSRVEAGDCKGAVNALNKGLAKNYPKVALLAGSMYDTGVCVRPDWGRAVHFYVSAHSGGEKAAPYRLASGYATPQNGPDIAAALWWASRDNIRIEGCGVSDKAVNDPDLFVAELGTWPQQRLATCNYVVGVMATLAGDLRYPERPLSFSLGADVQIRFLPAIPRMDVRTTGSTEYQPLGLVDGTAVNLGRSKATKGEFENAVRQVAERAIKRYPQPAGIPPDTAAGMHFIFRLVE